MKKSELKEIIKEALVEILPEVLMLMNEQLDRPSGESLVESVRDEDGLNLIRSKFREANPKGYDYGLGGSGLSSHTPAPENQQAKINGEHYASGKGILEWFASQGGKNVNNGEFKHTQEDMDNFISKKFGV